MTSLPDVLKIELRIEVNGQPLLIQAQVQGEGEVAQRAAAELSAALTSVLASIAKPNTGTPMTSNIGDGPSSIAPALNAAKSASASAVIAQPQAQAVDVVKTERAALASAIVDRPQAQAEDADQMSATAAPQKHPLVLLMQRHRVRINLGFGGLLLALAMLAPIVAPAAQRREMLIVTLLLGLTAVLMLFTAMLPGPERTAAPSVSARPRPAPPVSNKQARRALLMRRQSPLGTGAGLALGIAFLLLGVLAPFTLGATTADERFIITIGFSPIAVIGGFLVYIFWRRAFSALGFQPQPAHALSGRRSAAARVPQTASYRAVVPALLFGLAVFVIAVVIVVIYGTVSAALR
jgi:hypothetical protein